MARILALDDDRLIQRLISVTAAECGHEALVAASLAEGLALCRKQACDVVFLDVLLPDGNGLSRIPDFRALPDPPEIVIITGHGDPAGADLAIRHGAWDFLTKPLSLENLRLILDRVLAFRQQRRGAATGFPLPRGIVGESPALRACLDLAAQAAASDINVLLLGETGTGKEVFARAIHDGSPRAAMPFVAMDCASATQSLLESQLFGHTRGAFTGADQDRDGMVRLAHRGTLFLDEVGELPVELQRSFLRVLETRRFRPIGGKAEVASDFRLIAATNRNLIEMASLDLFRTDLLYRLNGIAITLPPLRERKEDIPLLCRHFVAALCGRYNACAKAVSDDLTEALMRYDWPGNVRELGHALERAFAASRGEPAIFAGHLPLDIRMAVARSRLRREPAENPIAPGRAPGAMGRTYQPYREFKDASEKAYLQGLLAVAANVSDAARLSGLSRGHLYQMLKKHGLEA
ncbi:MAG: sigma-54 dependent transcriptional regulator [Solidesulfovibrio sp.]|uniref:sigma-54-dependent transcriptional regulator n=1 Tax=Solidesulfovibrio sp. TaxID=2910990 RepID=UPI002B1ECBBE|nr:sigma-54 dependent transcriptional regulator [Solidesulfovibrio sp.]MEA4856314.1 sigma-54 dependent transcriptional regulator [Solidesulfovibrio sp.]